VKKLIYIFSITLCCFNGSIYCADTDESPGALGAVGYYASLIWNGARNAIGQRGEKYCLDGTRGTPQLYQQMTTQTELTLCSKHDEPAYKRLLAQDAFRNNLNKCRKRSYYDWKHTQLNITSNHPKFAEELCKVNIATLSPLLRLTAHTYLEEESFRQHESKTDHSLPSKLNESQYGYLEWSLKPFEECNKSSKELQEIIDDTQARIVIDCTWEKINRWVGKNIPTYDECLKYLTPEQEVKKSQAVYQNYLARLLLAARTGKTLGAKSKRNEIAALFSQPEFQSVFEQVWSRHCALMVVLCTLLQPDPSIDVCRIYENHWKNIPGLHAALIGNIILSKKQPQKETLPAIFVERQAATGKPIGKFIYLFVSSLNHEQLQLLTNHKDDILKTASSSAADDVAHNVYAFIKNASSNENQRKLLVHIAESKRIPEIFELAEKYSIKDHAPSATAPLQSKEPLKVDI
jgi:hypothetical protein